MLFFRIPEADFQVFNCESINFIIWIYISAIPCIYSENLSQKSFPFILADI